MNKQTLDVETKNKTKSLNQKYEVLNPCLHIRKFLLYYEAGLKSNMHCNWPATDTYIVYMTSAGVLGIAWLLIDDHCQEPSWGDTDHSWWRETSVLSGGKWLICFITNKPV